MIQTFVRNKQELRQIDYFRGLEAQIPVMA
jgi:hypothetical protein